MDSAVRNADIEDAEIIGRLLRNFNTEFDDPTPGPSALAERVRELLSRGRGARYDLICAACLDRR